MLQNNVTNETAVKVMHDLHDMSVEMHRTFTNAYRVRKANATYGRAIPSNNDPFDIINNFRRICEREVREATGV